jgi:hypothetical protein
LRITDLPAPLAPNGLEQPERELEDHRLAGAAGAKQDPHRALRHGETAVAQHDVIVEGQRHAVEDDRV